MTNNDEIRTSSASEVLASDIEVASPSKEKKTDEKDAQVALNIKNANLRADKLKLQEKVNKLSQKAVVTSAPDKPIQVSMKVRADVNGKSKEIPYNISVLTLETSKVIAPVLAPMIQFMNALLAHSSIEERRRPQVRNDKGKLVDAKDPVTGRVIEYESKVERVRRQYEEILSDPTCKELLDKLSARLGEISAEKAQKRNQSKVKTVDTELTH